MVSEYSLRTLREFTDMPHTAEKEAIEKAYLSDEIGPFELVCKAREYIDQTKDSSCTTTA